MQKGAHPLSDATLAVIVGEGVTDTVVDWVDEQPPLFPTTE